MLHVAFFNVLNLFFALLIRVVDELLLYKIVGNKPLVLEELPVVVDGKEVRKGLLISHLLEEVRDSHFVPESEELCRKGLLHKQGVADNPGSVGSEAIEELAETEYLVLDLT